MTASSFTTNKLNINSCSPSVPNSVYTVTATITNSDIWGESTAYIEEGTIDSVGGNETEKNQRSSYFAVTFGPSQSDDFSSCYDIHLRYPHYTSGIYYIKVNNENRAVYCEQDLAGGGWTLYYANSADPEIEARSYADLERQKPGFTFNSNYYDSSLVGLLDYNALVQPVSLMGVDLAWNRGEYGYITFNSFSSLKGFIEGTIVSGTSCATLPNGESFRYRNSFGMNYAVNTIMNWYGNGYGWYDCISSRGTSHPDTTLEDNPRHVIYDRNNNDAEWRVRGVFGFNSGNPNVKARYFLRESSLSSNPEVTLLPETSTVKRTPVLITATFSDPVTGLTENGISCSGCTVTNVVKSSTSESVFYFQIQPVEYNSTPMKVKVNENAAFNANNKGNLASDEVSFTLADELEHIKFAPSTLENTCNVWRDNWKSNEAGTLLTEFGIVAGGIFYVALSPTQDKSSGYYLLELGGGTNLKTQTLYSVNAAGEKTQLETVTGDLEIGSDRTTSIWVRFNDNTIRVGRSMNPEEFEVLAKDLGSDALSVQYVSFCAGINSVEYQYIYVGPGSSSSSVSVTLSTSSPNPTTQPFTVLATTSQNIKHYDSTKWIIDGSSQWISNIRLINPRQLSFLVTPNIESSKTIAIRMDSGAFRDQSGTSATQSNTLSIDFRTDDITAQFFPSYSQTSIPVAVTISFSRNVIDFTLNKVVFDTAADGTASDFRKISGKEYTFNVIPHYDRVKMMIERNTIHDESNFANIERISGSIDIGKVTSYTIPGMSRSYYTFLEQWKSTSVGDIWVKFKAKAKRGVYIAFTNSRSASNPMIEIQIGATDTEGTFTLHKIVEDKDSVQTTLTEVNRDIGLSAYTTIDLWASQKDGVIQVGTGGTVGENMLLTTTYATKFQYVSFTSGVSDLVLESISIGQAGAITGPQAFISTDYESPTTVVPIPFIVTFSEYVSGFSESSLLLSNAMIYDYKMLNSTAYSVNLYPTSSYLPASITVPCAVATSSSSNDNLASTQIVMSIDNEIDAFTCFPLSRKFEFWYSQWKFESTEELWLKFTAKAASGITVALSPQQGLGNSYYLFRFGDNMNSINEIISVRNGVNEILANYTKVIANADGYVDLWVSIAGSRIRMGEGSDVNLLTLCDATDLNPVPIQYFSLGSDSVTVNYTNLVIGPVATGFYATLTTDYSATELSAPIHVSVEWSVPATDFSLDSITSGNCKIFNFYNLDSGANMFFSFDAAFDGTNDCYLYIPENKVTSQYNQKNVVSKTVVVSYSEFISKYNMESPSLKSYNFYYDQWKSKDGTLLEATFSAKCTDDFLVALAPSMYANEIYQISLGYNSNSRVAIQKRIIDIGVVSSLEATDMYFCSGSNINVWITVRDGESNTKEIKVGTGTTFDENIFLSYVDKNPIQGIQYLTFTNNYNPITASSVIVGPNADDIYPTVTISTEVEGPYTTVPIMVTISFSEPVTKLLQSSLQISNCRIVSFESYSDVAYAEIAPLTRDAATVRVPARAVVDLHGNTNTESNTFSMVYDTNSLFDYKIVDNHNYKYQLWIDQWKTNNDNNLEARFEARGRDACIGFLQNPENEYPLYDVCINYNGQNRISLRKVDADGTFVLHNVYSSESLINTYDYTKYWFTYSASSQKITFGNGESDVLFEYSLTGITMKFIYVSFTNGLDGTTYIRSIRITPCDRISSPTGSFSTTVDLPAVVSPIPLVLSFSVPVSGLGSDTFTITNGMINNFVGAGKTYKMDFIPYGGDRSSRIELPMNAVKTRDGQGNNLIFFEGTYGDELRNYTCPPLFRNFVILSPVWRTNNYGTLWTRFTAQCESDISIRFSPWLTGGYPQYIITLGGESNTLNTVIKTERKSTYTQVLGRTPICRSTPVELWVKQESGVISVGTGPQLDFEKLFSWTDPQPVPSHYVSFSSYSSSIHYSNIRVGPIDSNSLDGFMYSDVDFPTNIREFVVYVQWNYDVTDFDVTDLRLTNCNVKDFTKIRDDFYSFVMTPSVCGISQIQVLAGAAKSGEMESLELVPFYADSCTDKPVPVITSSALKYSSRTPFTVVVTFKHDVIGFDAGDIEITGDAWITDFRSDSGVSYRFEVTPLGTNTEAVQIKVKANSLTDMYGNTNEASSPRFMPQYSSFITEFIISKALYNDPLILEQWSTGEAFNTWIMFDARCTNDLLIVYSKELTVTNNELYRLIIAGDQNRRIQLVRNGYLVHTVQVATCQPGRDVGMWAKFQGNSVKFGTGNKLDENVQFEYTENDPQPYKYIGLSNWDSPVNYRNIRFGPADVIPPRSGIVSNSRTAVTATNPVHMNATFTSDCEGLEASKLEHTSGGSISQFTKISGTVYSFDYTAIVGENYVRIPADVCTDASGRGNKASTPHYYTYSEGVFIGDFSTASAQITSTAPIAVTLTFSSQPQSFAETNIEISGGSAYLGDLNTISDEEYVFNVYSTDNAQTYLQIPEGSMSDVNGNSISLSGPFSVPRYGGSLTTFMCPGNRNGYPFYADAWQSPARGHAYISFKAKCTAGVSVGFGIYSDPSDKTNIYELVLGGWSNTMSVVRRGVNQVVSVDGAICSGDETDVTVWAQVKFGVVTAGTGSTIGENEIISYTDPDPISIKYIYLSCYTPAVAYSSIVTGPSDVTRPTMTVLSARGSANRIDAVATLSEEGSIWCIGLQNPSTQPSVTDFMTKGEETPISTESTSITVSGLLGGVTYDLWCFAESSSGVAIEDSNIVSEKHTVTTSGTTDFPIARISNIAGRVSSIYIEFMLSKSGTLYAVALSSGSNAPTGAYVKQHGASAVYNRIGSVSFSITGLETGKSYDVYFYAESILGSGSTDDVVKDSKVVVTTNGECPKSDNTECGGHGDCVDAVCNCYFGYHGLACNYKCEGYDAEKRLECSGHGKCSDEGVCSCVGIYLGKGCELECPSYNNKACSENGECVVEDSKAICKCNDGWTGDACSDTPGGPMSSGAVMAIIITCIVVVIILGVLYYCFCVRSSVTTSKGKKHRKKAKKVRSSTEEALYQQMS